MWICKPWCSAARTDVGKVRAHNEDAFFSGAHKKLWAVADGMGGHRDGDIASQLIINSLAELPQQGTFEKRLEGICQRLRSLNRRLAQESTVIAGRSNDVMGSTVVVLMVHGDRAACIWAGDSRCYLWRGQQLYQLSKDHSLQQQLMDEQHMSIEQAQAHPAAHALTRAIGATAQLNLGVVELWVHPGDTFLLCTDGLYQGLSHDALGRALSYNAPQAALERLFDGVLRGPATDNVTAVVIRQ